MLEALFVYLFFGLCKCLGYRLSSNFGGFLARSFGKHLKIQQTAQKNLSLAMPELDSKQQQAILHDMWDNLGRTVAEYAHFNYLFSDKGKKYLTINNLDLLTQLEQSDRPIIFLSAHKANWEIPPIALAQHGHHSSLAYRPANNKYVNHLIQKIRKIHNNPMYPKGKIAAKEFINDLKNGKNIGLLSDQKMNDGIAAPFFGTNAMSAPAVAQFYQKYNTHLVYIDVTRHNKHHFTVTLHSLDHIEKTNTLDIMTQINAFYETAIRQAPAQWMWVHRRWPKEAWQKS